MPAPRTRAKRTIKGTATVAGEVLDWELLSEQGWDPVEGMRGLRIAVTLQRATGRTLILQYPAPEQRDMRDPSARERPKVDAARVEADIHRAVAAGFDPLSRGRPRTMLVEDLPDEA
ncbi:hypothetical protein [Zavarzinia sp. CC-PAN008]|uniref:hypothetical protein n=1 Tax=Zavarzinia sp. CC-PAN008 TaxID=3243332 RepID=UPI003F74A068